MRPSEAVVEASEARLDRVELLVVLDVLVVVRVEVLLVLRPLHAVHDRSVFTENENIYINQSINQSLCLKSSRLELKNSRDIIYSKIDENKYIYIHILHCALEASF